MFMLLIGLNLILTISGLKIISKYSISEDSKLALFQLMTGMFGRNPRVLYFVQSFLVFGLLYSTNKTWMEMIVLLVLFQGLQVVIHIDLKCFRLPNEIVLPLVLLSLIVHMFQEGFLEHLLGGLTGFSICLFLALLKNGGLGGGDVKLAMLMGIWLSPSGSLYSLALGFIIGGVVSMILLKQKLINRKDYVPYGPYLYIGFVLYYFWEEFKFLF